MRTRSRQIGTRRSKASAGRLAAASVVLAVGACVVCIGAMPADNAADKLDTTRTALDKWIEVRRLISQEKRDLVLATETLNERIGLVKREIDSLHEKIGQTEKSIAEADKSRSEMVEDNDRLKEGSTSLATAAASLERRVKILLPRLPEPVREHVRPLSQRIPEDPDKTKLSVSERFQNVVGILNEIDRFNGQITVTSEVRTLPDGTSVEVTAMYVGIGQGYYVGSGGNVAGVGAGAGGAWTWSVDNQAAPRIAQAVAMFRNEQVASFVPLPVKIK